VRKDMQQHPVITNFLDEIAEQPMIKLHFKENTDPVIQEKLNKAFEEIRPRIERDLILKVLTNSGGII
jgi:hypothetical protein